MAASNNNGASVNFDSFKILRSLASPSEAMQGRSFVVESVEDGSIHALKMIECNDEYEVNKVLVELMPVLGLHHKYIAELDYVFPHYDNATESCYVCTVGDFYDTGDLNFVMNQYRSKESALPESIVKKWLGQLVEALTYIHGDQQLSHRAIKANNIYLTDSMDLCLGDFASSFVMRDIQHRPRTEVVCRSWLPPETDGIAFGFAADIWALGCVILDLGSTGVCDEPMCTDNRLKLRAHSEVLPEYLKAVSKSYSSELCNFLRLLLSHDLRTRPTIEMILSYKYTKECLKLCKSDIIAAENKKIALSVAVKPKTTKRIPSNPREIFQYLEMQMVRVGVIVNGLETLSRIALTGGSRPPSGVRGKEPVGMDQNEQETLIRAMTTYVENRFVQIAAIDFLRILVPTTSAEDLNRFVKLVLDALDTHSISVDVVVTACQFLAAVSVHEVCAKSIADIGGAANLVNIWRLNVDSSPAVEACVVALCGQLSVEDGIEKVVAQGCAKDAIDALDRYKENASMVASVCSLLCALAIDDEVLEYYISNGLALRLLDIAEQYVENTEVIIQVSMMLSSLFVDERCAIQVSEPTDRNPVQPIVAALYHYHSRSEIVETICALFCEMTQHLALVELLIPCDTVELMTRIKDEHRYRPSVANLCEETLRSMTTARSPIPMK